MIVDVVFVLTAVFATYNDKGGMDIEQAVEVHATRGACMQSRAGALDVAKTLVSLRKTRVFLSQCEAVPVDEITP